MCIRDRIEARRHKKHLRVVSIEPDIHLERLGRAVHRNHALARPYQSLRHVTSTRDFCPYATRYLSAAVDRLAAVATRGLEEHVLARLPQGIRVFGRYQDGSRNGLKLVAKLRRHAPGLEHLSLI